MGYSVSDSTKNLFLKNKRQIINITVTGTDGTFVLTESDIVKGTFQIDRYCVSGEKIEIGSAVASELTFSIDNFDGRFDEALFEGAELFARIGIETRTDGVPDNGMPLGYFIIDTPPRKRSVIEVTALDRMRKFDRLIDRSLFADGMTVGQYINVCCSACGVALYTDLSALANISYAVPTVPESDELTYRSVLQLCCAITGTCAYIDWNGELRLEWYGGNTAITTLTAAERYEKNSEFYEKDITVSGVICTVDDTDYVCGTTDYAIDISGNALIQSEYQSIVNNIAANIVGLSYRPYSCETAPMPWLYPLDSVVYADKKGVSHNSIVTHVTFSMNRHTKIEAQCETETNDGYYTPQTNAKQQAVTEIVNKRLDKVEEQSGYAEQRTAALYNANQMLCNALGLNVKIEETAGGNSYYFYNGETLESSSVVYLFNAAGWGWTDEYDGENTVWKNTVTSDGNAVLNWLTVNKLTADYIDVSSLLVTDGFVSMADRITVTEEDIDELSGELSDNYYTKSEVFTKTETSSLISQSASNITLSVSAVSDRVTTAEGNISSLQNSVDTAEGDIVSLQNDLTTTNGNVKSLTSSVSSLSTAVSGVKAELSLYVKTDGNGNVTSVIKISSNILTIDTDYFKLSSTGVITATGGTIAGFTIDSTSLTNSDGKSYIEISNSSGTYKTTITSSAIGIVGKNNTETGSYLSSDGISVAASGSSIKITPTYLKRTSTSASDYGKNTTVANGCITSYNSAFILGRRRAYTVAPYATMYEWGSYLKFTDYQTAALVYDSSLSGRWYLQDTYTGNSYNLTALIPRITYKFYGGGVRTDTTSDDYTMTVTYSSHGITNVLGAVVTAKGTSTVSGYNNIMADNTKYGVYITGSSGSQTIQIQVDQGHFKNGYYYLIWGTT